MVSQDQSKFAHLDHRYNYQKLVLKVGAPHTVFITLFFLVFLVLKIVKRPSRKQFPLYVVYSGLLFFFFGF